MINHQSPRCTGSGLPGTLRIPVMIVLLASGCATHGQQQPAMTPDIVVTGQQTESAAIPVVPPSASRQEETATAVEPLPEPAPAPPVISQQPATPEITAPPEKTRPAVVEKPAVTAPTRTASPPAQIQQPQKKAGSAKPPPAPQDPPPMVLAVLEQRLKDTGAIGVFTKLALKNQVDDLVSRIKAHHEGNGSATLAQLRQSYDQLLAKVHGLLKDGDPPLAGAIMASREAIWTVLTDPVKFAKL
ncbi:MAG: hypothetical protein ACO3IW_06755 [Burkholderiales bacterium]